MNKTRIVRRVAVGLAVMGLAACQGDLSYREAYGRFDAESPDTESCEQQASCKGLAYYDCGFDADGPAYYVEESTWRILEQCSTWCRANSEECCVQWPPPEWTCPEP